MLPTTPSDGGADFGEGHGQARLVHHRLVGQHRGLLCLGGGRRLLVLLHGDGAAGEQVGVALGVGPRLGQVGLVAGQVGLRLHQGSLGRALVQQEQQVAGLDLLPLLHLRFHQLAVDAGAHLHGGDGLHRAHGRHVNGHGAAPHARRHHRHRAVVVIARTTLVARRGRSLRPGRLGLGPPQTVTAVGGDQDQGQRGGGRATTHRDFSGNERVQATSGPVASWGKTVTVALTRLKTTPAAARRTTGITPSPVSPRVGICDPTPRLVRTTAAPTPKRTPSRQNVADPGFAVL
ncbi:hypothetical protein AZA_87652 [Nitrospirillum viridazoti Y2]|nr:hypothetical protein AZA_87652 [Nitrospirillum amazonense Y2]